jgi:uncharacterized repeat protein (TIGR01451 family)
MKLRPAVSIAAALLAAYAALPAHAVTVPSGPAASADAYGLLVDVQLLPTHTPVRQTPLSHATQDYPPGAAQPATASLLSAGPQPADGSVLNHAGAMSSIAGANGLPNAVASAQVADVSLLGSTGNSLVSADLVRAQAATSCTAAPSATGTTFVHLRINGTDYDNTPAPNTVIDLQVAKVILNEQHPANDGRGIVVNAIHVLSTSTGDALFRGDVIVSHAMSTVSCTNGAGSTGGTNQITMTKSATPSTARAGDEVTYAAAVTNHGTTSCLVNQFIEHLSPAFDFVSTVGDFGTALDRTIARPGGGDDLILGNGKLLAPGATFRQTFVVKVKDTAAPGVYYNNLEILCANVGDFVKGLDAPVRVTDDTTVARTGKPQCSDGRDNDGDGVIDYPADPGCASPVDDDERNAEAPLPRTGGGESQYLLGGLGLIGLAVLARKARAVI